jgi:hypothetical protein
MADPRSNRERETAPLTPAPATAGGVALPARPRRRRAGLNPWYFILIAGLPVIFLGFMLLAVSGQWPPPQHVFLPTPTPVWDKISQLQVDRGPAPSPAPDLGSGWYIIHATVTNNSPDDLQYVNLRGFLYDNNKQVIGSGVGEALGVKHGETRTVDIQAQLMNGPVPKPGTPLLGPPAQFADYEVKIVYVIPAATPVPGK